MAVCRAFQAGGSFDLGHLFEGVALTDQDSNSDPQTSDSQANAKNAPAARRDRSTMFRFAGLGIELATSTLLFAGIGYFVDWLLELEKSYGTAAGTLVGFTIGMFRFIQQALKGAGDSPS